MRVQCARSSLRCTCISVGQSVHHTTVCPPDPQRAACTMPVVATTRNSCQTSTDHRSHNTLTAMSHTPTSFTVQLSNTLSVVTDADGFIDGISHCATTECCIHTTDDDDDAGYGGGGWE